MESVQRAATRIDRLICRLAEGSPQLGRAQRAAAEVALARHRLEPDDVGLAHWAATLSAVASGGPVERQLRDLTGARLYAELGARGDQHALAVAHDRFEALSMNRATEPSVRREAWLGLGGTTWRAGNWPAAADAYERAMELRVAAADELVLRPAREAELMIGSEAAPRAALAHARAGAPWRAVEAIERGRAVLMNARGGSGASSSGEVRAHIEQAAARSPLAYLVPLAESGLSIVVDGPTVRTLELPDFTTGELIARLDLVVDPTGRSLTSAGTSWPEPGEWLWQAAMGPLLSAVSGDEITLVPCGLSAAMPLQGAWRVDPNQVGQPRYVLDDLTIRYAPSARWANPPRASEYRSVLAVANPDTSGPSLPYAESEIMAIPRQLEVTRLIGPKATLPEVLQLMSHVDILHFACHGKSSVNPLESGVVLAEDRVLSAREIIDRQLRNRPLVILSACETAVIGRQLPDEVVSLQAVFLAAGASGVVATLSPVDDQLAAWLIKLFYHELVHNGRSPAQALRASQRSLHAVSGVTRQYRDLGPDVASALVPTWVAYSYAGG